MTAGTGWHLVIARSHGKCEGCGRFGYKLDPHHRQARGAGGVHRVAADAANDPRNGLALCRSCHDQTEHAQTWGLTEQIGWRIPHFVDEPLEVPALIHTVNGFGWHHLTEDAGYRWMDPGEPTPLNQVTWVLGPRNPLDLIGDVSAVRLRMSYVMLS